MKFLALFVMLAAFVATSWAFKNAECGLRPSRSGSCYASMTRWSYNPATQRCVEFTYGGCGGNANRFDSKSSCEARCKT